MCCLRGLNAVWSVKSLYAIWSTTIRRHRIRTRDVIHRAALWPKIIHHLRFGCGENRCKQDADPSVFMTDIAPNTSYRHEHVGVVSLTLTIVGRTQWDTTNLVDILAPRDDRGTCRAPVVRQDPRLEIWFRKRPSKYKIKNERKTIQTKLLCH